MYNLESQITEFSECILLISYVIMKVGGTAWEGCPNNAVFKQCDIYMYSRQSLV